jgi:NAD(P)-dependent dehydrogenase (short-subunit alcohol dehydrogenase family)
MAAERRHSISDGLMRDKVVLITGATSGIGSAAAAALAAMGATLVMVARDRTRGDCVLAQIRRTTGNDRLTLLIGDLAEQSQVRRVAAEFKERHDRLDVLINNAGAVFGSRSLSPDGYELTFALNHLAYFLLTAELTDVLTAGTAARVVNTASVVARRGQIDFSDLQLEHGYRPFRAYSNAKLANMLFTFELARRLAGSGVTANCMHPGFVRSRFGVDLGSGMRAAVRVGQLFARSATTGAETLVYLAGAPEVAGVTGAYYFDLRRRTPPHAATDEALARRLWEVSERLTTPAAGARAPQSGARP